MKLGTPKKSFFDFILFVFESGKEGGENEATSSKNIICKQGKEKWLLSCFWASEDSTRYSRKIKHPPPSL